MLHTGSMIAGLTRYAQKSGPGQELREAALLAGLGMEGNFHQGGERQLSLLTAEIRRWINSQAEKGLCFKRFKENILIEWTPGAALPAGARLRAGEAVLRTSDNLKRCHAECALFSRKIPCRLAGCAVFAVVEHSGSVRVGDKVSPMDF